MNNLNIISRDGQFAIDSRDVAEMTNVRHSDLLEKIDTFVQYLTNGKVRSLDFFIPGEYTDGKGEVRRKYDCTRKGCDMVANKMTGEKGVLFTATYVTKFEEMEKRQGAHQLSGAELIAAIANQAVEQERRLKQLESKADEQSEVVETIKETFLQRDDDWRKSINKMLNGAAYRLGGGYQDLRNRSYDALEERAKCNLKVRLGNLVERLEDSGATKTQLKNTSRMDVIEADPRLKEIYSTIVKELSIGAL